MGTDMPQGCTWGEFLDIPKGVSNGQQNKDQTRHPITYFLSLTHKLTLSDLTVMNHHNLMTERALIYSFPSFGGEDPDDGDLCGLPANVGP